MVQILLELVLLFCFCKGLGKCLSADADSHGKHLLKLHSQKLWQEHSNDEKSGSRIQINICDVSFATFALRNVCMLRISRFYVPAILA